MGGVWFLWSLSWWSGRSFRGKSPPPRSGPPRTSRPRPSWSGRSRLRSGSTDRQVCPCRSCTAPPLGRKQEEQRGVSQEERPAQKCRHDSSSYWFQLINLSVYYKIKLSSRSIYRWGHTFTYKGLKMQWNQYGFGHLNECDTEAVEHVNYSGFIIFTKYSIVYSTRYSIIL